MTAHGSPGRFASGRSNCCAVDPPRMTPSASPRLPALPALLLAGVANCWRRKEQVQTTPGFSRHFAVSGIDLAHIERYRRFFDFRRSTPPLTYFYLLAQRAQLALMFDRRFPHTIPGLIHSGNELRLHAVPRADSNLEIQVSLLPTGDAHKVTFTVAFAATPCSPETTTRSTSRPCWPGTSASAEQLPMACMLLPERRRRSKTAATGH